MRSWIDLPMKTQYQDMKIDTRRMLPSDAKAAITAHFLKCLESSKIGYLADPIIRQTADFYGMVHKDDDWGRRQIPDCYAAAWAEYNRLYPKCWDNERQKAYREFGKKRRYAEF